MDLKYQFSESRRFRSTPEYLKCDPPTVEFLEMSNDQLTVIGNNTFAQFKLDSSHSPIKTLYSESFTGQNT